MEYAKFKLEGKEYCIVPADDLDEKVGRAYIRQRLGVSNSTMSRKPWAYPDYGKALRGHKGTRPYSKKEVDAWLERPEHERIDEYKTFIGVSNESKQS